MWLLFGEDPLQEEIKLKSSEEDLISIPIVEARLSAGTGSLQVSDKIEHTQSFPSSFLRRKGNPRTMDWLRRTLGEYGITSRMLRDLEGCGLEELNQMQRNAFYIKDYEMENAIFRITF